MNETMLSKRFADHLGIAAAEVTLVALAEAAVVIAVYMCDDGGSQKRTLNPIFTTNDPCFTFPCTNLAFER